MKYLRRYDLTPGTSAFLLLLVVFFGAFLVYPLGYVFREAFIVHEPGALALLYLQRRHADVPVEGWIVSREAGLTITGQVHELPTVAAEVYTPPRSAGEAAPAASLQEALVRLRDTTAVTQYFLCFDPAIGDQARAWLAAHSGPPVTVQVLPPKRYTLVFFRQMVASPVLRTCIVNSLNVGAAVTLLTTLISVPLAYFMVRFRFRGRGLVEALLLVPMVLPPFVGAIGMRQFFARFGSVNLLLMKLGLIHAPIDWFSGGGFLGVVILEALHLYPIMYLNVAAALANVDPSLEEAAENVGAHGWTLFRTITFPLLLPGYFAGAVIVFIWAFTDLGTPLVFEYRSVVPVQIFNMVADIHANPLGYALVVLVILLTVMFFYISKRYFGGRRVDMIARGHVGSREVSLRGWRAALVNLFCFLLIFVATLPHLSVALMSITQKWFMTVLPSEVTGEHYHNVMHLDWSEPAVRLGQTPLLPSVKGHDLTVPSIKNSLRYSLFSTLIDLVLGVLIAYLLTRRRIPFATLIDATAMLPLALPGLVLAFGYVGCYSSGIFEGSLLDPFGKPGLLLILAYAVRRLPYSVRAAYAGFQQTSVVLEEASQNLGATPFQTLRRITLPLVMANLVAGAILSFSFAMLEVSDSLILAIKEEYYPITKAIYNLLLRVADGPYVASAMGMLGMILLIVSLVAAGRFLGQRLGELFRA
jgi:iron(III) transport system permease protein